MIYQRLYSIKSGFILVDILLAMSLSLIFIIGIVEASEYSHEIFYKARERSVMLDTYEADLEARTVETTPIPYGNDREENVVILGNTGSSSLSTQIVFTGVRTSHPTNIDDDSQYALCSVDFTDRSIRGSYEWQKMRDQGTSTYAISVSIISHVLPISPTLPLTDLEVRGDIAFVSVDSNVVLDPDMFTFKLWPNGSATILSYVNTGPGISAFAIGGKYIYGAAPSTAAQLHIIGQDPMRNLSLVKKYQLPLPYATATPALGSSIAYDRGRVILGTEKWAGEELSMVDVSNREVPTKLGGLEIGAKVSDINIFDGTAYVSSAGEKQFRVIDTRNVPNLGVLAEFSRPGWQRQEGKVTNLFEGRMGFGRTAGGYNVTNEHEAFFFDTTSTTTGLFTLPSYDSVDMPGGVYGIIIDRQHRYLITRQAGRELEILDHSMNASSTLRFTLPSSPQAMTCYGDKIYVLSHTQPVIYEIGINRDYD